MWNIGIYDANLFPRPVLTAAAAIPCVIHLTAVLGEKANTLSSAWPLGTNRNASTSSGWAGTRRERAPLPCSYHLSRVHTNLSDRLNRTKDMQFVKVIVMAVFVVALITTGGVSTASAQGELMAPTTVTAANGSNPGEVTVSWDAVPDAQYYRVGWVAYEDYETVTAAGRDWLEAFAFVDVANRGQVSHSVTRLTPGILYYFIVASNNSRFGAPQWSDWSPPLTLNDAPVSQPPVVGTEYPLAIPQNFTAVAKHDSEGDGIIYLSWDAAAGVSEYRVCRKSQADINWICGWDGYPRHESTIRDLAPGVTYDFAVRSSSNREMPGGTEPVFSEWVFASATALASSHNCPDDAICDDLSNTALAHLWLRLWEEQTYDGNYKIVVSANPYFVLDAFALEVIVRSGSQSAEYCNTSDLYGDEGYTQMGCSPLQARLSDVTGVSATVTAFIGGLNDFGGGLRCVKHNESTSEELVYACQWRE